MEPLQEFTSERWATIKSVLSGDEPTVGISKKAACAHTGISIATLNAWERRSAEKRDDDDPMMHEVAEFLAGENLNSVQGQTLEDTLIRRALVGDPKAVWHAGKQVGTELIYDNRLLEKALKIRDKRYAEDTPGGAAGGLIMYQKMTIEELKEERKRLLAQIDAGEGATVINGDATDITPETEVLQLETTEPEPDASGTADWDLP